MHMTAAVRMHINNTKSSDSQSKQVYSILDLTDINLVISQVIFNCRRGKDECMVQHSS